MTAPVDLRQLAVRREAEPVGPRARRRWLTRYVLPAAILAGLAALLVYAAWDTLSPPRPVTVVPVIASRSEIHTPAGSPLFQGAGWVEPWPRPELVTALAEGVVESVAVVEGQDVKRGDVVARLVADDAKLAVAAALAEFDLRDAEVRGAKAAVDGARVRLELPVHLQAELGEAEAALARAETELALLPAQLATAASRLKTAQQDLEGKKMAQVPPIAVAFAESQVEAAENSIKELKIRQKRVPEEVSALKRKRDAVADKLERKPDEVRQFAEAEAALRAARARLRLAQTALDTAELRERRLAVVAPTAGRVLAVLARPGSRLMGMDARGGADGSTVVLLYDPAKLQARVDVRLDDVGKVLPGQRVKITGAALGDRTLDGEVLLPTSQADIQKNTLPVKIAIHGPASVLSPEMLVQVTFLAPPQKGKQAPTATLRLLVPKQLVESSSGGPRVWVADRAAGRARLRNVKVGASSGELVEIVDGLQATDRLIVGGRDGLQDGQRITVTGEDDTLGSGR